MNHLELGKEGENIAVQQLIDKKHRILERNFRFGKMEIDIISSFENLIVITEVKTRNSEALGAPYLSVGIKKQRNIIRVADQYIQSRAIDKEVRFDVISIVMNAKKRVIKHIEGAFCPFA
jgi:putative endonuclease